MKFIREFITSERKAYSECGLYLCTLMSKVLFWKWCLRLQGCRSLFQNILVAPDLWWIKNYWNWPHSSPSSESLKPTKCQNEPTGFAVCNRWPEQKKPSATSDLPLKWFLSPESLFSIVFFPSKVSENSLKQVSAATPFGRMACFCSKNVNVFWHFVFDSCLLPLSL